MNISGVVVFTYPEHSEQVRENLLEQDGVEVHAIGEKGQIVVTVEQESDQTMADTVLGFTHIPGVLSASMVYHHFDEIEGISQEARQ